MEALYSSFLPKHTQLSFRIDQISNLIKHTNTITANSSSTTSFVLKNPPSNKKHLVQNRKNQSILAIIFNKLDDFICNFIDLPLRPSIDPKHVLSGNLAPVDELPPTACAVVEGSLPSCLDGAYIRNGPNPQFIPNGPYHFLDGDGMLHVIKISQGKATFCCRYVNTHKHAVEREIGYPFVPSVFSSFNGVAASAARAALVVARILAKQFDPLNHGVGTANTSVARFAGGLFALCESDLPYAVHVTPEGDITTLGRHDFEATEPFFRVTAHPKIDTVTGEAFAFGYNITAPFLTFFRVDSGGQKQKNVPIFSINGFACIHDFAVTENYAVFPDIQIAVNPMWILRGRSPAGVDAAKVPRLGIIPKYAEDEREMWWVDTPGFNMMHCFNAWEEDGSAAITLVASNVASVEQVLERVDLAELTLEKITINVKDRTVVRQPLSNKVLDLGVINPAYAAKKNRYVYAAVIGTQAVVGVVKLDLSVSNEDGRDCTVASRLYGPGCYSGEPFFVAREPNNPMAEEDDGYLVTYVHDENIQESKFLVMDAKSSTLDIVAAVKLPQRVPGGFHGLFVPEFDLPKI
ncbi:nine-cis-epoxycarotenoid dioxygenase 4 [Perilla frutescens var. frutescens]|nr:nine-cis-epoxycarotenoid dioxygenase 4 [Perilla frutescens var. frutescens]